MLQEYCLVRGSCFRCYRNIFWLEGVASDVTGLEGVASDVTGIWLEGVRGNIVAG